MVQLLIGKADCCGCTTCMNVCLQKAITMQPDEEGFLYPEINSNLCNECGLCKKVCVFQNPDLASFSSAPIAIYAMKNADEEMRLKSQSGGFSHVAASRMVEMNGIVYGACFGDHTTVCHKAIETRAGLSELQGSKYVQSLLSGTFASVKNNLQAGRKVLFTGTPCQVSGLNAFLKNSPNIENLLTLDIVCHGVPSPMIFKYYLEFSERKYHGKITNFNFRDKMFGWRSSIQTFMVGGKKYKDSVFSKVFYSEIFTRPSCYKCLYTTPKRVSDITMADFWGVEKCMPEFDDNKGTSLLLINTPKGMAFFKDLSDAMILKPIATDDYLQAQLKHPPVVSPIRDQVWREYRRYGFPYIAKKYCGTNFRVKAKEAFVKVLKRTGVFPWLKAVIMFLRGKTS